MRQYVLADCDTERRRTRYCGHPWLPQRTIHLPKRWSIAAVYRCGDNDDSGVWVWPGLFCVVLEIATNTSWLDLGCCCGHRVFWRTSAALVLVNMTD